MNKEIIKCDLQMFADGEASVGTDAGATGSGATAEASMSQPATDANAAQAAENTDDTVDREKAFLDLVNGEYKDAANKWFKDRFGSRVKGKDRQIKELQDFQSKVTPMLDSLSLRYGTAANDLDAIIAGVNKDKSYIQEYAIQHGVSDEQAQALIEAQRIIANDERVRQQAAADAEFQKKYDGWLREAEQLKAEFPGFDFEEESQNPEFRERISAGIPMKAAYVSLHYEELLSGAMAYTYHEAKKEAAAAQQARAARPQENGTTSQQSATVENDLRNLTAEQRRKINDAIRRGENVTRENIMRFIK